MLTGESYIFDISSAYTNDANAQDMADSDCSGLIIQMSGDGR
ncbi:MAG TPA: hypothetical protein V6D06_09495 [Trichocoleus sp.]